MCNPAGDEEKPDAQPGFRQRIPPAGKERFKHTPRRDDRKTKIINNIIQLNSFYLPLHRKNRRIETPSPWMGTIRKSIEYLLCGAFFATTASWSISGEPLLQAQEWVSPKTFWRLEE